MKVISKIRFLFSFLFKDLSRIDRQKNDEGSQYEFKTLIFNTWPIITFHISYPYPWKRNRPINQVIGPMESLQNFLEFLFGSTVNRATKERRFAYETKDRRHIFLLKWSKDHVLIQPFVIRIIPSLKKKLFLSINN